MEKDKADIVDALGHGAFDFLSKPVHVEELRSRIAVGVRLIQVEDKLCGYTREMKRLAVTVSIGVASAPLFVPEATGSHYLNK